MKTEAIQPSSIGAVLPRPSAHRAVAGRFDSALEDARFTISRHAASRLSRRGLAMDEGQANRLAEGIDKAASRGSKTSLVLMDELALLVKVPERMVMTAMSQSSMRDGVVTRIDSAVVV